MPATVGATVASVQNYQPVVQAGDPVMRPLKVDISTLSFDAGSGGMVDAYGVLRPGSVLRDNGGVGVPINGASQSAAGVVVAPIQLAVTGASTGAVTATSLAAETGDHFIEVGQHFYLNQEAAVANLGVALSANELASLPAAMVTCSST
jgi:hypothetical protein